MIHLWGEKSQERTTNHQGLVGGIGLAGEAFNKNTNPSKGLNG